VIRTAQEWLICNTIYLCHLLGRPTLDIWDNIVWIIPLAGQPPTECRGLTLAPII